MIVLHYTPSIDLSSGGVGIYMQTLAKELGKLVELHIATHHDDHELQIENCTVHYLSKSYQAIPQFQQIINELHPDVVHSNTCWAPMASFAVNCAKKMNIPVVYSIHGMLEPWILNRHHWTRKVPALLLYQKKSLKNADVLLATAESERQNILKLGYNNQVEIVQNGVDIHDISIKKDWKKTNKIVFLSRIHPKKGIEFLIEAAAKLKSELTNQLFIIAGEGEDNYCRQLQTMAERQGVKGLFSFVGGVYGEEKWMLLRDADIVVLPTYSENFGIIVAEALASGTPVITTQGTPWQELESHHCGWWTEIGTEPLCKALKEYLNMNPDQLQQMGANGRQLVEDKYSTAIMARKMTELYESLTSR